MSDNERLSVAVTVDWTDALQKKIRERYLYLAPGAAAVSFEPGLVHIDFPSDDPQPRPDQQAVADFVADQQRSLGRASERVLLAHDSARPAIPDPLPDLIERGEVSETADGAFTFAGAFARRFTAWDGLVRDLADPVGRSGALEILKIGIDDVREIMERMVEELRDIPRM